MNNFIDILTENNKFKSDIIKGIVNEDVNKNINYDDINNAEGYSEIFNKFLNSIDEKNYFFGNEIKFKNLINIDLVVGGNRINIDRNIINNYTELVNIPNNYKNNYGVPYLVKEISNFDIDEINAVQSILITLFTGNNEENAILSVFNCLKNNLNICTFIKGNDEIIQRNRYQNINANRNFISNKIKNKLYIISKLLNLCIDQDNNNYKGIDKIPNIFIIAYLLFFIDLVNPNNNNNGHQILLNMS